MCRELGGLREAPLGARRVVGTIQPEADTDYSPVVEAVEAAELQAEGAGNVAGEVAAVAASADFHSHNSRRAQTALAVVEELAVELAEAQTTVGCTPESPPESSVLQRLLLLLPSMQNNLAEWVEAEADQGEEEVVEECMLSEGQRKDFCS